MLYIYLVILLIYALVFMVKDYEKNIQLNILEIIFICVATVFAPNLITWLHLEQEEWHISLVQ